MEKIIHGAKIYTMDPATPRVEAVRIVNRRVESAGTLEEVTGTASEKAEIVELDGESLLPGFVDAHVHFLDLGLDDLYWLDLSAAASKEELFQRLEEGAKRTGREGWVLGTGWDESKWEDDGSFPDRYELDRVFPDRPVALGRVDMHTFSVNSPALELIDLKGVRGAKKRGGAYTGVLTEDASLEVRKAVNYGRDELKRGLRRAVEAAGEKGVTSIHQMAVQPGRFEGYLRTYQALLRNEELRVRSCLYFTEDYLDSAIHLGLESGFGGDRLTLGGLKLFSDGSIGSRSALLKEPYADCEDEYGMQIHPHGELLDLIKRADENGLQVAVHAIGDGAIEEVVSCFEELEAAGRNPRVSHRIEHAVMATDEQARRMGDLGLVISAQPNFTGNWGLPGDMYEERLGSDRLPTLNRFEFFRRSGLKLAFGSDGMPFGPLYGVHWAVNAPFESARMEPYEAVKAYTLGGAKAAGTEDEVGSIEPGKYADFVLLDRDPMEEPEKIKDMDVKATVLGGETVYSQDKKS